MKNVITDTPNTQIKIGNYEGNYYKLILESSQSILLFAYCVKICDLLVWQILFRVDGIYIDEAIKERFDEILSYLDIQYITESQLKPFLKFKQ